MKKAVIRADAGARIGGGHVGRCLAIAEELRGQGWYVTFACRAGTIEAAPLLAAGGWPLIDLGRVTGVSAEAQSIAEALGTRADLVLVDHYGLDAEFEAACRRFSVTVAVLDDVPGVRAHDADALIDAAPGRTAADWEEKLCAGTLVLAGAPYALVRPEVSRGRNGAFARQREGRVARVLVSFGMADARNATVPALRAARAAFPQARIDVVIGPANLHRSEVSAAAAHARANLHIAPSDYVKLLAAADLAVGAGGVSAMERACLGVPSVAVETALNQRAGLEALAAAGALVHAGPIERLNDDELVEALAIASDDLPGLSARAAEMIDGGGARRAVSRLDEIVRTIA